MLNRLFLPERIADLPAGSRDDVLHALCDLVSDGGDVDGDALRRAVIERERLHSTGFGEGLAMPHVRMTGVKDFHVALGRVRDGVDFAAIDGEPVRLLMLIVGPEAEKERYQKLMARSARFLKAAAADLLGAADLTETALQAAELH